jgi:hypothetical protein
LGKTTYRLSIRESGSFGPFLRASLDTPQKTRSPVRTRHRVFRSGGSHGQKQKPVHISHKITNFPLYHIRYFAVVQYVYKSTQGIGVYFLNAKISSKSNRFEEKLTTNEPSVRAHQGARRKEKSAFDVSFVVKNSLGFLTLFQL